MDFPESMSEPLPDARGIPPMIRLYALTLVAIFGALAPALAHAQSAPTLAPEVKTALNDWVQCAASAAKRFAPQHGDVADMADAALGACDDAFSRYSTTLQHHDAQTAAAAGDGTDFIAQVQAHDAVTARRERSELRARLMALILDTRANRAH